MIKKYKIQGLDCPNCAKSLETKLNQLQSVKSAKINFVKSTVEIESENPQIALQDAINLTKKLEPDAVIVANKSNKNSTKLLWLDIGLLLLGLAIGIVIFCVKMPDVLYWILFVASALILGYKTYYKAFNLILKGVINENLLVTISVVGATLVGEHFDALMVICLYSIGKILESIALNKSKKSIEELTSIKPEFAVVVAEDGTESKIDPTQIKIDDILVVKAGEKIAVDGIVQSGSVSLDTQSLTGESLPQFVTTGDQVLSGSIVLDGVVYIKATKLYADSTASKIIDMIENASEKKAKTETVISKISKWYTLGVIVLAVAVWGIVWAVTKDINTAVYRGLIFLVVSCPCAFAISVPLAYFSGIGNASKNGILIKGSNYLDVLAKIDAIAFDKTGTITTGEFEIQNIVPNGEKSIQDIIFVASVGEQYSNHPLAKAIVKSCTIPLQPAQNIHEIAGSGVEFDYNGNNYFVGRKDIDQKNTSVQVWENQNLIGTIYLCDKIKPNSKSAVDQLKSLGVTTIMLSGDNEQIVNTVANSVGIDQAYSKLLPQQKFDWIQNAKGQYKKIGYVGDGINDAPALTLADVGMSMGIGGSSVSIESSDIVIANDNLQKIVDGIKISKYTSKIVWENIIAAAAIKVTFLSLGAFGVTGMLSAVIADVGVTLIAILNSLRALKYNPKPKHNQKCNLNN